MLRWLLPVIAAIALVGSSVTAWAAAGVIGDASCCCPVKAKCKCHDHDGKDVEAKLKRCGGEAKLVTPVIHNAIPCVEPEIVSEPRIVEIAQASEEHAPDDVTREPEKPPF